MKKYIAAKNQNVRFAKRHFQLKRPLNSIENIILRKVFANVKHVGNNLKTKITSDLMKIDILQIRHFNAKYVLNHLSTQLS